MESIDLSAYLQGTIRTDVIKFETHAATLLAAVPELQLCSAHSSGNTSPTARSRGVDPGDVHVKGDILVKWFSHSHVTMSPSQATISGT